MGAGFLSGQKDEVASLQVNDGVLTGTKEFECVAMSFETGEQTTTKIYFPFRATITQLRAQAMKAIAGTDNGTITASNSTGAMANGVITFTAGDAIDTSYATTPTTNNIIPKDDYIQLVTAKTTAGGKVNVTIEYQRS